MKIRMIDENNIIVFLNKFKIKDMDFTSKQVLEEELKHIFKELNVYYDIKIYGYYNITIYIDKYYGVILELEKEDIDYMSYDSNQIDMRIVIINNEFVYQISDIFNNYEEIIKYKNNYYLRLNDSISNIEMGKLIEYNTIIYGTTSEEVIKFGTVLKNKEIMI